MRIDENTRAQDPGYPRDIKGNWPNLSFTSLDAALDWGGGKVYFFKGDQYVRYSKGGAGTPEGQDSGYPRAITGAWPNLSFDSVDAAVDWGDGSTFYFFKGDKYARYLKAPEGQQPGYPKSIKGHWVMGCLVIGHHGAQIDAPENTRESIVEAFARGADIVEVDVRQSLDQVPILLHSDSLKQTAGIDQKPSDLKLSDLQKLDVGSWQNVGSVSASAARNWTAQFFPNYPANTKFKGARIPTLAEALLVAQNRGIIYVDVKDTGAANINAQAIRANDPTLTLTAPSDAELASWRARGILGLDFDYQANTSTPPGAVARLKNKGFLVFMYNVNDDSGDHEQRAIDFGVDGVITNDPNKMSLLGVSLKEVGAPMALRQP